ncbi:MAG TPA: hypothetical protein PK239_05425 [Chitinophagales bacterium]|nr:hypothetical protein [Chitinophagales bacterium]
MKQLFYNSLLSALIWLLATQAVVSQNLEVEQVKTYPLTGKIEYLTYNPQGSLIAAGLQNGTITVVNTQTGENLNIVEAHVGVVNHVEFSSDGKWLASASNDGTVKLWQITDGIALPVKTWQNALPTSLFKEAYFVVFSPDNEFVFFGGKSKKIKKGKVQSADTETETLFEGNFDITIARLDNTGRYLTFANGYAISFLDIQTGKLIKTIEQKITDYINDIVFSPDGKTLAAWCEKGLILLWDYPYCNFIKTIDAGNRGYSHLHFNPSNTLLASGNLGPAFRLWNVESGSFTEVTKHVTKVNTFAFHPITPNLLATGSYDRNLSIWRISDKADMPPPPPPVVEDTPPPPPPQPEVPKINDRPIISKANFTVASPNITVNIWDDRREDGDIISLYLNGECILSEYTLVNKVKSIKLTLGINRQNTLVLHAHNLGEQPPNTAAISISDGKQTRRINLSSDFEGSEAIILEYVPQ